MKRSFRIVSSLGAAVAPLSLAQTLTHGDATFQLISNPPFSSTPPETNFKTDATSGDFMSKCSWWCRAPFNSLNRLTSDPDTPTVFSSGGRIGMTWNSAGTLRSFCLADLNNDGVVDDTDFVIFAAQYNTLVCP
jgi:hypothetical protein